MTLFNHITSRRAFLQQGVQLSILITGFRTVDLTRVSYAQAADGETAYGVGTYGQNCYGECTALGEAFSSVAERIVDHQNIMSMVTNGVSIDDITGASISQCECCA